MTRWLAVLLLATTACTDATDADAAFRLLVGAAELVDGLGGDGGGNGDDVLPKPGAHASDPTILSARAFCSGYAVLAIQVDGNDPKGSANLHGCSATLGSDTETASFAHSSCLVRFETVCNVGDTHVVDITISNEARDETTASVTLTAE